MPEYLKDAPHGYCQRCDQKYYLHELMADGYHKNLMVCDACFEEDHPQLYPVDTSGPESVLPLTLPPNERGHAVVSLGGHTNLADLLPIIPAPMTLLPGRVEVVV